MMLFVHLQSPQRLPCTSAVAVPPSLQLQIFHDCSIWVLRGNVNNPILGDMRACTAAATICAHAQCVCDVA